MASRARPISPHLSVYRFTLTMTMSIFHRITGIANYAGTLLLIAWLASAAIGGGAFEAVQAVFGHVLGQLVLFGYTWSLFHHMLGGLRHFVWDSIRGLDHPDREWLVWVQVTVPLVLTVAAWAIFVWFR